VSIRSQQRVSATIVAQNNEYPSYSPPTPIKTCPSVTALLKYSTLCMRTLQIFVSQFFPIFFALAVVPKLCPLRATAVPNNSRLLTPQLRLVGKHTPVVGSRAGCGLSRSGRQALDREGMRSGGLGPRSAALHATVHHRDKNCFAEYHQVVEHAEDNEMYFREEKFMERFFSIFFLWCCSVRGTGQDGLCTN
jgi:hypothetical protein